LRQSARRTGALLLIRVFSYPCISFWRMRVRASGSRVPMCHSGAAPVRLSASRTFVTRYCTRILIDASINDTVRSMLRRSQGKELVRHALFPRTKFRLPRLLLTSSMVPGIGTGSAGVVVAQARARCHLALRPLC
jgi:hypothetical protein